MDRIAEIANASKRTVYNHFASKELLFQSVISQLSDQICTLKKIDYSPERPLEEQLADFVEAKLATTQNPSLLGLIKVVLSVMIKDKELAQKTIADVNCREDALVTWLEAAQKDGKLSINDCEEAAKLFWSMVIGAFWWPAVLQAPLPEGERARQKQELIKMFLKYYEV